MNLSMRQKRTHRQRTDVWLLRGVGGGTDWEFEISRCKLTYREQTDNKVLLNKTGSWIH